MVVAIKNFIFHNLYKEFLNTTKALNKPLTQLDFKPLHNEIKALPYKANANLKAHLKDMNAKTNNLLDSMHEFKKTTQEIKLLPYNKPTENKAVEVDRFSNVLGGISKTRDYQVITDKKAFIENLNVLKRVAEPIPPTLDIQSFLKTLDNVENKENFIEHLSTRSNAEARLAYLNLVEPTLKRADIELTFLPNKKEYIKSFKDKDNNLLYLLVTKDNDKTLITGIPDVNERYVRSEINKADIIHSFVPLNRQTTEVVNGLQQNPTTKQEISKEIESKSTMQDIQRIAELKNNLFENMEEFDKTFKTPFEIAEKYHYVKDKIQKFEALPPALTEQKFFEDYTGLVAKFLKKNLKFVPSIYDEKGKWINLYNLHEMVNSFNGLEKFKNSLENKSYSALGILMPLKDSKMLDELKVALTELNKYLQKQHKKLSKNILHTTKKER